MQIVEMFSLGQQMKQQGRRNVVGQIAGDPQSGASAAQGSKIKIQGIGMMNPQDAAPGATRPQRLQQVAIQFYHVQLARRRQQRNR